MTLQQPRNLLHARDLGVDTHFEPVVFLRSDSPVCRSEGLASHNRVLLSAGNRHVIATLYQVHDGMLAPEEAGLSETAWRLLGAPQDSLVRIHHAPPVESLSLMRRRIYGHDLDETAYQEIIGDIVAGRYSAVDISAFVTACAARPLSHAEVCGLTRAMINTGDRLRWDAAVIADKHSVGGIPGNRTTPIIVPIVTALGLVMPKTSSRAITSPAGTADTMGTIAPVDLDQEQIRTVVEREGGCIAWGGAVDLSPADDILIRIERALDLDSEGQMIASILSKKVAAGATHLVVDMPVGATAKVRDAATARSLSEGLRTVAAEFGLKLCIITGDGNQPLGRGMGPALEARDVLAVLQGKADAPADLRARALALSAALLEMTGQAPKGAGLGLATQTLESGAAWAKFQRICAAQGGMREPPVSRHRKLLTAPHAGTLTRLDNRRLARLAKLAGAPDDAAAGIEMHARLGDELAKGDALCTVHAQAPGELSYALAYAEANTDIFRIT